MKVGIVQVDGKLPNLALMQITGYHESQGDQVEWFKGMLFRDEYKKVYASKIFSFSTLPPLPEDAIIGGTGINYTNRLPDEISSAIPSYSLYPNCNYHLGFSMKGCRFNCKFCCVPKKEGRPSVNNTIEDILINPKGGNRLMLLDNDFFGGPNWKDNLEAIIKQKLRVCFAQGLNIRIITSEQAGLLSQCNYTNTRFNQKYLTFAWDRYNDGALIKKGIKICNEAGIPCSHMQFFILIGYDTTPEQDYERVMTLSQMGCIPYVMAYDHKDPYQKSFERWVNHRGVFKSCSWEDYKYKRIPADQQIKKDTTLIRN
jgi:hypothetical protein